MFSLLTSALLLAPYFVGDLPAEDPHHSPVFCLHVGSQARSLSVALAHRFDDWSSSCAGKRNDGKTNGREVISRVSVAAHISYWRLHDAFAVCKMVAVLFIDR